MSLYSIESEKVSEMTHTGEVTVGGERAVELSDEEVDILVKLIKEKGSTDVRILDLENLCPAIYEKLDHAYRDMAYKAEEIRRLWDGYYNGCYEYDFFELMDYCEKNLGFTFFVNPEDYFDDDYKENPEPYEEIIDEAKSEAFFDWLNDYVEDLSDDEARDFFYTHMHAKVDLDHVDYTVGIPQAVINKAEQ